MLKYIIDKVAKDAKANTHVVYVKLYDDKNSSAILSRFCIPFENQAQFEAMLEQKKLKYTQDALDKESIKALAEQSIAKLEVPK